MDNINRIVCHFSCGVTSAVATKITLSKHPSGKVVIVNAFIKEEHPDNRRFLADCEKWFNHPVTVVQDTKYGASTHEVWRRSRFIKSRQGAPCTKALKRDVLDSFALPGDVNVIGYDLNEIDRRDRFIDANNHKKAIFPLIDECLTKSDCLAIVSNAGIELPMMYKLGFHNANCIMCPKGGMGYANKIRKHFPEQFYRVAEIQKAIGLSANFYLDSKTGKRISLLDLEPDMGNSLDDLKIDCSYFCELVERDLNLSK